MATFFPCTPSGRRSNAVSTTMETIGNVLTHVALGVETDSWSNNANNNNNNMQQQQQPPSPQQQQMSGEKIFFAIFYLVATPVFWLNYH